MADGNSCGVSPALCYLRHVIRRQGRVSSAAVAGLVLAALAIGCAATSLGQSPAGGTPSPDAGPVPLAPPNTLATPGVDNPPPLGATFNDQAADQARAAAAAAQAAVAKKQLDALQATAGLSQQKIDNLKAEIANMNGDKAKQSAALIAAGQRLKIAEIEVQSMEERMSALAAAEAEVHGRLDGADASISNMLAALERISLNPPPALIVDPQDALGSARGAILISAILPQLKAKADQVVADLKKLEGIKAEAVKEQDQLRADYAVLEEEQLRIATLIQAKKQSIDAASQQLSAEEQQAADLGGKVDAMKQLVASLNAKAAAVSAAASAAHLNLPATTPEAVRAALANTSRTAPALPFPSAKGYLTLPAAGTDVADFGANDGYGGISKGLSLQTPPKAQVVAPADGWVVYKGPFLNYGQIVILNPGQDYTILLAGLETVSVNLGQFVLEGQPVGAMGSRTIGRNLATSAGVSAPTLYIELRKNDEPVDPHGWWASPVNTTQSG
jgi:septal ring factor EnvC (AmiA/AmiB activator)